MVNDRKVTGKKYRILTNAANRAWDVISFWTSSKDVEMDDGNTLEKTMADVKSIANDASDKVNELTTMTGADITNAPDYSSESTYQKGDIVKYNGSFYYCKTDITIPEPWNSSHWELITNAIPFRFGIDGMGRYGYYKAGADSVTPFKGDAVFEAIDVIYEKHGTGQGEHVINCKYTLTQDDKDNYDILIYGWAPRTGPAEHVQYDGLDGTLLFEDFANLPSRFKYVETKNLPISDDTYVRVASAHNYVGLIVIGIKLGVSY